MRPEHVLAHLAPQTWMRIAARRVFANATDRAEADDVQLSASQRFGVVPQAQLMEAEEQKYMLALSGTENFKHVEPDDFIISLRSFEGGFEHSAFRGCVSPAYTVLRPRQRLDPGYFRHLFKSHLFRQMLAAFNVGVRDGKSIRYEDFAEFLLVLPPLREQRRVAEFLDRETARIDALIETKTRFIELLREKRIALIRTAVTRGLMDERELKPSGVDWLGSIPVHWRVSPVSYIASVDSGSTPDRNNPEYWGGDVPWIKTGEVNYEPIVGAEEHITGVALRDSSIRIAQPGTLLLAMYGQGVTRGRVAILTVPAAYNQACAAICFAEVVRPEFGRYFFIAAYDYIRDSGNETSQMNLSTEVVRRFKMTVPPLDEQIRIVGHLDRECRQLDQLREQVVRSAALLSERRAALITAAVTGQIDARAEQPAEDLEPA